MPNFKPQWRAAYENQAPPDQLVGGLRQFNGYRHPRSYALLLNSLKRAAADWRGLNILDVGCGTGDTHRFLAEHNRLVGLDFSAQMLRHAQKHNPRVALGDGEHLPFAANSFQAAIATGLWQCLPSDSPFLSELRRVVGDEGQLILGWVLNADYLLYRRGVRFRLDPDVSLTLYRFEGIKAALSAAGWRLIEVQTVLFPFGAMAGTLAAQIMQPFAPAYTLRALAAP